jgi:voltage-gated potassium channel
MQKRIAKLKDHYIVCGAGRMGYEAVLELVHERKGLVVVDRDIEKIRQLEAENVPVIQGDATHDEILLRAGVEHARGLLATLPEDAANVFVSLSARVLNPNLFIIARGTDESSQSKLLKAGANRVVLPYHVGGKRMASMLVRPEIVDFFDVVMGKDELSLRMEIIRVRPGSPLAGHSLKDSNIRRESGGALIMGIIRKDGKMIPTPDRETQVLEEDQLLVLGHLDQIARLEQIAR